MKQKVPLGAAEDFSGTKRHLYFRILTVNEPPTIVRWLEWHAVRLVEPKAYAIAGKGSQLQVRSSLLANRPLEGLDQDRGVGATE